MLDSFVKLIANYTALLLCMSVTEVQRYLSIPVPYGIMDNMEACSYGRIVYSISYKRAKVSESI
jgi:hypothetical protein